MPKECAKNARGRPCRSLSASRGQRTAKQALRRLLSFSRHTVLCLECALCNVELAPHAAPGPQAAGIEPAPTGGRPAKEKAAKPDKDKGSEGGAGGKTTKKVRAASGQKTGLLRANDSVGPGDGGGEGHGWQHEGVRRTLVLRSLKGAGGLGRQRWRGEGAAGSMETCAGHLRSHQHLWPGDHTHTRAR
eukprot:121294-Chlamydomonas_euryale.AAC.7